MSSYNNWAKCPTCTKNSVPCRQVSIHVYFGKKSGQREMLVMKYQCLSGHYFRINYKQ